MEGGNESRVDALNRPIQLIYVPASGGAADTANTQNTTMTYDANGNRTSITNNADEKTTFTYDSSNRLIQTTLPTGESAYKSYNGQGLISSETDFNGNTTFYTYDEQGHIIQVTYPDQSNVKYYWCCCQICKYIDPTGTSNLSYDALHRLSSMSYSSGKTVAYEYNGIGLVTKITDPDANNITYAYNSGGLCTSMVTSADAQTTTITYDALRRRSTVTYPTTTNVVTTYTYDNLDRITKISSVAGATTYSIDYSYVSNKDILSQQVIKLNAATVSTIDLTYDSAGRVTEEKVTKPGPVTSYQKQYTYDKVSRRLTVKDVVNGNWLETSTFDLSGRLTRITVTAGTGSNPFSWPKGTTNVTCDANGNITQLWGRNVDDGTIWKVAHQFDYEQRVVKILLNNGDTVDNLYDGMGYRLKETTTSGGTPTPVNFVPILGNRVAQTRDGSDAVTARYYWDRSTPFKKDHGSSTKYFVPEIANSPFTGWNNAGTFNRYDLWDTFGVLEDQSAAGSLSPFELFANIRVGNAHLTATPRNGSDYPEIGRMVGGLFALRFLGGGGGGGGGADRCGPCTVFSNGMICPDPKCYEDLPMPHCPVCTPEMERVLGPCCGFRGSDPPCPPNPCGCNVSCSTYSENGVPYQSLVINCPDGWWCAQHTPPHPEDKDQRDCWGEFSKRCPEASNCNPCGGAGGGPPPPPPPGCNMFYGNCCGYGRCKDLSGKDLPPIDALDKCCCDHDDKYGSFSPLLVVACRVACGKGILPPDCLPVLTADRELCKCVAGAGGPLWAKAGIMALFCYPCGIF